MKVSERVYQTLRRQLMVNHYEPGTHLREEMVAAELSASRTPVRSAFQRLITEGLLSQAETRGAIVTGWRKSDTEEIFKLRVMLEGYAASLAAQNITDEQLEALVAVNNEMRQAVASNEAGRIEKVAGANKAFHEGILDAAGQGHLRMFSRTLLELPMVIGFFIYTKEEMMDSVRQHDEIIAAVRSRNSDWAQTAMATHLYHALERFRHSR